MEDAWIDWAHLDGYDTLERLRGEGYKWQYVGRDIPDDLDVPGGYVLITDEFPGGDVLVSKKFLDPRLAKAHGIVAISLGTRRGVTKKRIMDYYQGRTGPIVVTTPPAGAGKLVAVIHKATRRPGTWQGSKFDADGPYGHHEGDTQEAVLDELIEMGFTEPEPGGMKRILGVMGNPSNRAKIKKLTSAEKSYGDRAAEFRTGAKWGLYWDDELVAEIVSSTAGYMEKMTWAVQSLDWRTLKNFSSAKTAKAWAIENAEAIAALGPNPGPDAQKKLFILRGYQKVGPVWKKIEPYQKNPPYSGYDAIYFKRPMPDDPTKISYQKKRDALNVFLDWNRAIVDDYGGEGQRHNYASFDAINHRFGIEGKRRVDTIAKAVWWALPAGSPYYLEDIDVELLNQTAPAIFNPRGLVFTIPDYAEEQRLLAEQAEYWEERYGFPEDDEEVPF